MEKKFFSTLSKLVRGGQASGKASEGADPMLEEIGQRVHEAEERLGDTGFKGIPARVASLLLKLSNDGSQPIRGMTHRDLYWVLMNEPS